MCERKNNYEGRAELKDDVSSMKLAGSCSSAAHTWWALGSGTFCWAATLGSKLERSMTAKEN